jgi:hypothetical protein
MNSQWIWKIVIPSYNRSEYLKTHTLAMCIRFNIPQDRIFIFVATEQKDEYIKALKDYSVSIIDGPVGLKNMRNFITGFFNEGEALLCMDDDIDDLYSLYENTSVIDINKAAHWKLALLSASDFYNFTRDAYYRMVDSKKNLFGIYPVKNGFFMKDLPAITHNPRFCVGTFWGIINKHSSELILTMDEKEDMERSIIYSLQDGGVIRYNHITLSTKYYKTSGGMQSNTTYAQRIANSFESSNKLVEKYPTICELYNGKKNGMCEVRFKRIKKQIDLVQLS